MSLSSPPACGLDSTVRCNGHVQHYRADSCRTSAARRVGQAPLARAPGRPSLSVLIGSHTVASMIVESPACRRLPSSRGRRPPLRLQSAAGATAGAAAGC
jgi:hypothetical protein